MVSRKPDGGGSEHDAKAFELSDLTQERQGGGRKTSTKFCRCLFEISGAPALQ